MYFSIILPAIERNREIIIRNSYNDIQKIEFKLIYYYMYMYIYILQVPVKKKIILTLWKNDIFISQRKHFPVPYPNTSKRLCSKYYFNRLFYKSLVAIYLYHNMEVFCYLTLNTALFFFFDYFNTYTIYIIYIKILYEQHKPI